jgi:hypothetical protein
MLRYYPSENPIRRIKIVLDGVSLDQLRAFIAAVDEGSFSAGARKLHRAQSAVSELVSNLEAQLGVALFDRSERYPKLTPAGIQLVADARSVVANVDLLKARAKGISRGLESELSWWWTYSFQLKRLPNRPRNSGTDFLARRCDCMLKRSAAPTNLFSTVAAAWASWGRCQPHRIR